MKYENLYKDFIAMFPEDSYFFKEKENETGADVTDGIHVVFGMVVVLYVTKIVKESSDKAQKAFAFFEKMEKAEDDIYAYDQKEQVENFYKVLMEILDEVL